MSAKSDQPDDVTTAEKVLLASSSPRHKKTETRRCFVCHEYGHLAKSCKKKKRDGQNEVRQSAVNHKSPDKSKPKVKTKTRLVNNTAVTFTNSIVKLAKEGGLDY